MPAIKPTTTDRLTCHHWLVSVPNSQAKIPNVTPAIKNPAVFVPTASE